MNLHEDKICNFLEACARAGIHSPVEFLISKRPQVYDWLKGSFPRGILPTDIDGEVEINGHYLRFEFKHESVVREGMIPRGQMMALNRLLHSPKFTVLIIGCNDIGDPCCVQRLSAGANPSGIIDSGRERIQAFCRNWSEWAERQTRFSIATQLNKPTGTP